MDYLKVLIQYKKFSSQMGIKTKALDVSRILMVLGNRKKNYWEI